MSGDHLNRVRHARSDGRTDARCVHGRNWRACIRCAPSSINKIVCVRGSKMFTRRATSARVRSTHAVVEVTEGPLSATYRGDIRLRDNNAPMILRHSLSDNWTATTIENGTHVLIDVLDYTAQSGPVTYDYFGCSVKTFFLRGTTKTFVYYQIDQFIAPTTTAILATLSRHFTGDTGFYYNDPTNIANLTHGMANTMGTASQNWTPDTLASAPESRISGEHHIHFRAEEIWEVLDTKQKERATLAFTLPKDSTNTFITGVMLWAANADELSLTVVKASGILASKDVKTYMKSAKALSIRAKSYQNLLGADLRQLFELDVLVNRIDGSVDWETEKNNRTNVIPANLSYDKVFSKALSIFQRIDITSQKPRRLDWVEFWSARWQWSASSSIHSQYLSDTADLPKERDFRNKFIALLQMEEVRLEHFLDRPPTLMGWSSTKYEWGKLRAIYGTDLTSYVLAHFAFYNCEETLPREFPVGSKASDQYVTAQVSATLEGMMPLCLDYEDFNSQHSTRSMGAVIDAYVSAHSNSMSVDQVKAAQWTKASLSNVVIHDSVGTKSVYKAKGTLLSGWRLTSFMNSVLNKVYMSAALGHTTASIRSVHNGDDILAGINNFATAVAALKGAKLHSIRLQRAKCAFGGIAEFLRVDHTRGSYGQYLTRSVATLLHSRIESGLATDAVKAVSAMESRFIDFFMRGGDPNLITRMRDSHYKRIATVFDTTEEVLHLIKRTHNVAGGCENALSADITHVIEKELVTTDDAPKLRLPGVAAYAKEIVRVLHLTRPIEQVAKRLYNATLNAVSFGKRKIHLRPNDDIRQYSVYRSLYKAHSQVIQNVAYGKAQLVGFVFDILSTNPGLSILAQVIAGAKDPMTALRILV